MPWSVVVNAGKFDVLMYENILPAAEAYFRMLQTFGGDLIELKPTNEVRKLKEEFIEVEFPFNLHL
jgi:hypothetical protein